MSKPYRARSRAVIFSVAVWISALLFLNLQAADFRITSIRTNYYDVELTWDAQGGSNYVVQTTTAFPQPASAASYYDVSNLIYVPGTGARQAHFTNFGALFSSRAFYRIKSPALQSVLIVPTNAVIGRNMTNRYQVLAIYSDNRTNDVTREADLAFTSSNTNVARVLSGTTNGYVRVHGRAVGNASLRAVFRGFTNTASLAIERMTGIFTVPATIPNLKAFVEEETVPVKVFGIFASGQTNNITASCIVEDFFGGPTPNTRLDYKLRADVANAFALITGVSAAAEEVVIVARGETNQMGAPLSTAKVPVNWCWFYDVTVSPEELTVGLKEFVPSITLNGCLTAVGCSQEYLKLTSINSFAVRNPSIASVRLSIIYQPPAYAVFFIVTPQAVGSTVLDIVVNNGPGTCAPISLSVPIRVVP